MSGSPRAPAALAAGSEVAQEERPHAHELLNNNTHTNSNHRMLSYSNGNRNRSNINNTINSNINSNHSSRHSDPSTLAPTSSGIRKWYKLY